MAEPARHDVALQAKGRKTWAYCYTCRQSSKQGSKAQAEAWRVQHIEEKWKRSA